MALAAVSARASTPPRLFRVRDRRTRQTFDPTQHLLVQTLDLNSLARRAASRSRLSVRSVVALSSMAEKLGIDMELTVFADRLLSLPKRRRVYLEVLLSLKRLDEPFDDAFWNRLADVLSSPDRSLPGRPAAFAPLHFAEIGRVLSDAAERFEHGSRSITYSNTCGMPQDARTSI